jgi:hypothetical protein
LYQWTNFSIEARPSQNTTPPGNEEKSQVAGNAGEISYKKRAIGADVQAKIEYADKYFRSIGMTDEQVLYTLGIIDHESGGTWSETTVGDHGCSIGIAQYNTCAGNFPAKTYEGQVEQVGKEMLARYQKEPLLKAVIHHNMPSWDVNPKYEARIKASIQNFYK